jgi:hypothetical protein
MAPLRTCRRLYCRRSGSARSWARQMSEAANFVAGVFTCIDSDLARDTAAATQGWPNRRSRRIVHPRREYKAEVPVRCVLFSNRDCEARTPPGEHSDSRLGGQAPPHRYMTDYNLPAQMSRGRCRRCRPSTAACTPDTREDPGERGDAQLPHRPERTHRAPIHRAIQRRVPIPGTSPAQHGWLLKKSDTHRCRAWSDAAYSTLQLRSPRDRDARRHNTDPARLSVLREQPAAEHSFNLHERGLHHFCVPSGQASFQTR